VIVPSEKVRVPVVRLADLTQAAHEYLRGPNCRFVAGCPLGLQIEVSGFRTVEEARRLMGGLISKVEGTVKFCLTMLSISYVDPVWLPDEAEVLVSIRPLAHFGPANSQQKVLPLQVTVYKYLISESRLLVTLLPEGKA